jgi:hypothetical protein
MTILTSFNSSTDPVDAIETLNDALASITALKSKVAAIPPLASFGVATLSQNEGNSGTTAFVYPVNLDKPWASDISFEYVVSGAASNPTDTSDFVGGIVRGVVTFPAGVTAVNLSIPVAGDTAVEQSENFVVRLYRIAASSLGTILNDDVAPALNTLTVSPATATRGAAFSGTISGLTSGSSISLTGAGAAGLSISGAVITGTPTTAGAVNIVETLAGATGSPKTSSGVVTVSAAAARTTQPWTSGEQVYAMDPDQISGADGSRVTSHTDPASSIVATAPGSTGPLLVKNVAAGHAALRFAGNAAERLSIGRPAAVVSACAAETNWSFVLVLKSPNGSNNLACPFGDDYSNNGTFAVANGTTAGAKYNSGLVPYGVFAGDVRDDIKVLIYSGETMGGARGRHFYNGVPSQVSAGGTLAKTYDAVIGCGSNNGSGTFPYTGDILGLYIISKALSAPEALQAYLWACNKFGKTSPLAGRTYFPLFDGDSHTAGVGATNTTNYVAQLAIKRGWPVGAWGNVGKPSATVASTGVATANTMMDKAPRDTDGFADVTGLPVVLMTGEWYNQGGSGGDAASGTNTANNNRTYATTRKATGKFARIGTWTSMASATRIGAGRDGFNASLVSTPGDFDFVVPIHTDSTIGVDAKGSDTTVFPDGVHPNAAGYTVLTNLVDAALTSAGYST